MTIQEIIRIKKGSSLVLTEKEIKVINKKLLGKKLSQQDSNYLSRYVRPKLREISSIDSKMLLNKMEYHQKSLSTETRIKTTILKCLENVSAIILYGSAIQNNYSDYNDIDILIIVKKKFWEKLDEKYKKIIEIKKQLKENLINADLEVYDLKTFKRAYPSSPSLIYQLKDSRMIYGNIHLSKRLEIPKIELRMKADYSIIEKNTSSPEIYKAIRNLVLITLVMRKIVNNRTLLEFLNEEIGANLAYKLKTDTASAIEKKIALLHLNRILTYVLESLKEAKWEKIVLSNH